MTGSAEAARSISLALVLHNHQPVGNFGWVFEQVYRAAYEPMLAALERHPGVRVALHYSGPLLEWLEADHLDFIDRLRVLVDRGQVEVLGGGLYEPVLVALPERDRRAQLRAMSRRIEGLFGRGPAGAWLAERVWEPSLPSVLAPAGYRWTVVDDNHVRVASVDPGDAWAAFTTDDQGERVTLLASEQGLRYRIPFRPVDELIDHLRSHATEDGHRIGVMGDDGEKFGAWPHTFEHCWGADGWVDRCFAALEANADWLRTVTPSSWLESGPTLRRVYVPATSYVEMTQWALPPDQANVFHTVLEDARRDGRPEARFLQGGTWRDYQSRYREINDLHKQMLRASARVDAMPGGPSKERARDHLFRGQSNDCYWHGLFGGIYIVHMRMAALAHLIAAEDIADDGEASAGAVGGDPDAIAAGTDPSMVVSVADHDLDGADEVLLSSRGQVVLVDPGEGGGLGSWDLRATRMALLAVMRRRPEAYHATLLEHERREQAGASSGKGASLPGPPTIHDLVVSKEPGLSRHLIYDAHERRSGLVHLLRADADATVGAPELRAMEYEELGDFADGRFELEPPREGAVVLRREGTIRLDGGPHGVTVVKRLRAWGGRLDPCLEVSVEVEARDTAPSGRRGRRAELALEWGFNLMGGGGNPDAYYEWMDDASAGTTTASHDSEGDVRGVGRMGFGNRYAGVHIDAYPSPPARVTWFPIETISNSEAGFERAYQGSSLSFRWPVALEPGTPETYSVRFQVRQDRDLSAREPSQR